MAALLTLSDVALTFGGDPVLNGAALSLRPRARLAVVGRNGSGKSTLLKIAAGLVEPDAGVRYLDPSARVAYLPQEPDLSAYATALDVAREGAGGEEHRAERLLGELDLDPGVEVASMSGGERRRAAIARALASDPDVLLLDEPTNHLDLDAIEALEARLNASRAAIALISHDRRLLEALTDETLWVDRGRTRALDRGFADFEAWRDKLLDEEAADAHKLDRKIAAEEDWVRYGVTARRKRNVRRMAELEDLRRAKREARGAPGRVAFAAHVADPSAKRAIVAENVSKAFGDRTIVSDFSTVIARGDRVGVVGANGAGNSTLVKLLIGELAPDAGTVEHGPNLKIASLDQRRAALAPTMRVADAITDGRGDWVDLGEGRKHVASYLRDFLFAPEQWRSPVSVLSGGERGRLALAAILARPSNLLVLDEPTNDLDLETLDLLQDLVADYPGALLVVSHDRSFVDRIATSVIAPALDDWTRDPGRRSGRWIERVGGYGAIEAERSARTSAAAPGPAPKKTTPPPPKPGRGKLTYNDQRALERLPAEIDRLTQEAAALAAALEDPALFSRDPAAFQKKADALADARSALAAAEETWLELEMKREALES
ncbi:MAG: ABC-F family ATP-binding cassette domain-containing protein [Parvularculaceae bacterium]